MDNMKSLADFYKIFPEYNRRQFSFKYLRNEIYIIIHCSATKLIIFDYHNDHQIYLILRDSKFNSDMHTRNLLRHKYKISFNKSNEPICLTNMTNLRDDYEYLNRLIEENSVK